ETPWSGPWRLLAALPLFDSVVPTRLALVVTPVIGVLLALLVDRQIVPEPGSRVVPSATLVASLVWTAALCVALVPLVPTPQPTPERTGLPRFFSSGHWRDHLPPDATVLPVPGGWFEYLDAMQWSTSANQEFRLVGGYFLAPDPDRTD